MLCQRWARLSFRGNRQNMYAYAEIPILVSIRDSTLQSYEPCWRARKLVFAFIGQLSHICWEIGQSNIYLSLQFPAIACFWDYPDVECGIRFLKHIQYIYGNSGFVLLWELCGRVGKVLLQMHSHWYPTHLPSGWKPFLKSHKPSSAYLRITANTKQQASIQNWETCISHKKLNQPWK